MDKREIVVPEGSGGGRIDVFLTSQLNLSRNRVQFLCADGHVRRNGKQVSKNLLLNEGDIIEVDIPPVSEIKLEAQDIPLDIIYEDNFLLVINKPKGLVVHPGPGHPDGTLVNAVMAHCGGTLSGIGGELRPGIVHRIDKDTSGLILVAKTDEAHAALSRQLKDHTVSRVYHAVAIGNIKDDSGTIDAPIGRSMRDRKRMAVGGASPREAVTHYSVIARYSGYTHVLCELETGRTHQIRVHMASIGHPLAGDILYGGKAEKEFDGQCLHAGTIRFIHPETGKPIEFSCPLPEYFILFLEKLRRTL